MSMSKEARVFSFGGGVQSVAVLVLQATGRLLHPYDKFIFANVGADSENPDTLDYLATQARPYAERHGIEIVEVQKTHFGTPDTVLSRVMRERRSISIPVKLKGGAPGHRLCTIEHKIKVVDKYLAELRYTNVDIGLGISTDEIMRIRDMDWHEVRSGLFTRREYPLIDLRLNRSQCASLITSAGLPLAPKSSCWFCPFKRASEWNDLKRNKPELFAEALTLEAHINDVCTDLGKDPVFLHPRQRPLSQAVGDQSSFFDVHDTCDTGYCMT